MDAELVLDAQAEVGEGPVWDARSARLLWVDILRSRVHTYDPVARRDSFVDVGRHVGAVVPRQSGGYVLALADGFAAWDGAQPVTPLAPVEADRPGNRMNDGKVDPHGRFWAGTMAYDPFQHRRAGTLYRLDPDHSVHALVPDIAISNGLDWSADARRMYYIDSLAHGVDVFDYDADTGAIGNRRRFIDIAPSDGIPDGMTLDAEGHLWVALYGGSRVRRYAPEGRLVDEVRLPVRQVTSCAFGGSDYQDLYITSAGQHMTPEQWRREPHAGGLFRARPGVAGRASHAYAG